MHIMQDKVREQDAVVYNRAPGCNADLVTAVFVQQNNSDGTDDDTTEDDGSVDQRLPQLGFPVSGTVLLQRRH